MHKFSVKAATVAISFATVVSLSGAAILPVASAVTIEELQAQIAALQAQLTALSGGSSSSYNFTRDLTVGSTGDDVKALQQWLNNNGYSVAASGPGSTGNETSYFGSLTQAAVSKYQTAKGITPTAGYFGPITRASLPAAGGTTGGGTVVVPGTGLAVSLAGDNPTGTTVAKSSTNVTFLKFNVAGNGTVTNVTVKRGGAGATTDFSNVYLYEGTTRLTSGRSLNSTSHEATFSNLSIAVSGVRTLSVIADMGAGGAANRNSLSVTSLSASVAVSGLPATGNEMTLSSATAGSVVLTKTGSLSNPNIGQQGAQVSQFRVDASGESVTLKRISLFFTGTVSKSSITNLKLKDNSGNTLATASGVNAKDLAVFELSPAYSMAKGDSKTFAVWADIAGSTKKDDTIEFYIDEASDVYALGDQYGQGVSVTKDAFDSGASDHHKLTLQGSTVTLTFNGPNAGDIKKNGKDLTLYDFTIASANNIEIRNLRWSITASTTQNGPDDLKVVDVATGVVVAGPKDDASGTQVFTDVFTVNAGQSRRLKLTADTDTNWIGSDAITAKWVAFTASDIKNLDNNQFLATTEITPSSDVTGNLQTVKAPTLEVTVAGTPTADSFVKGKLDAPMLGINLRAIADDIKINTIKISSSPASGTLASAKADVQSVRLFDGSIQVGTAQSLTGDALPATATFTNLNFTVTKGQSKVLTVKANISSAATANNKQAVYIADVATTTGVDVVAVDTEGREPTYSGSDAINDALDVKVTVLSSGTMRIAGAPADSESKAGIVLAGASKAVTSKFNFTSASEDLTVNKLSLLVNVSASTSATSVLITDEVSRVYLYDGSTLIGSSSGYSPVGGSGVSVGDVVIEDLSWLVAKDTTKTLTVKADVNTIAAGADTGTEFFVNVKDTGFQATGAASTITAFTGASNGATGNQKVVYKTYPTVDWVALSGTTLSTPTDLEVARFKVKANSAERIEWGAVGVQISVLNASFSDAALTVRDVTNSVDVAVGTQAPTSSSLDFTADATKSAILYLTTPEQISAGSERTYIVKISATATQFGTAQETETLTSRLVLHNDSSTSNIANAAIFSFGAGARVDATLDSADNAFVWSDFSASGHGVGTSDWANGVYLDTFPGNVWTLTR